MKMRSNFLFTIQDTYEDDDVKKVSELFDEDEQGGNGSVNPLSLLTRCLGLPPSDKFFDLLK